MANDIGTPKMSEILLEEFMTPLGVSADRLAQNIHVPAADIKAILHDEQAITPKISAQLGKYFGVSPQYFLRLQNDISLRNARYRNPLEFEAVK